MHLLFLLTLLFSVSAFAGGNERVPDFNNAKKILNRFDVFSETTLYCGCKVVKGKNIDMKGCGYVPPKKSKRAGKMEWEHVVPASALSGGIAYNKKLCGKKKSKRQCLESTNGTYARRLGDMYNLYAEDGLINHLRSDKPHEELTSSDKSFGKCDIKIGKHGFTARKEARGIVARTYLYMDKTYPNIGIISSKNRKLYDAWNKLYPVTSWECNRTKKIESLQGNENEFVKKPCQEKNLWK